MVRISLEYRFGPRSILTPGDRFRVKGGAVYVTDDGRKIVMSERGIFTFQRFCQAGRANGSKPGERTVAPQCCTSAGRGEAARCRISAGGRTALPGKSCPSEPWRSPPDEY